MSFEQNKKDEDDDDDDFSYFTQEPHEEYFLINSLHVFGMGDFEYSLKNNRLNVGKGFYFNSSFFY